jgi:AraC-like DNA-binding protein
MTASLRSSLKESFLDQVAPESHFDRLFDCLPGVSFFAKNRDFQLVAANRDFWERLGMKSEAEMIGKTDFELFPDQLARNFRRDDEEVVATGRPKLKIVELFFNRQGLPDWYFTHKYPVRARSGEIIGVMGLVQSYARRNAAMTPYLQLDRAVGYLRDHFREPITVTDLAKLAGMSVSQFNRRFQEVFHTSPRTFLIKTRIQAACASLRDSDTPISEIAIEFGFYDQSSFTQHFRRHMGLTPLQFRKLDL